MLQGASLRNLPLIYQLCLTHFEQIPSTKGDWADVASDAIKILRNMSPRKSDLQEFWKLVSKRSSSLSVDSLDLSVYIFQERKFRLWIDAFTSAHDVDVYAPSAAQRYAASILLFNDDFHFKRNPTRLGEPPSKDELESFLEHDLSEGRHQGFLCFHYTYCDFSIS